MGRHPPTVTEFKSAPDDLIKRIKKNIKKKIRKFSMCQKVSVVFQKLKWRFNNIGNNSGNFFFFFTVKVQAWED